MNPRIQTPPQRADKLNDLRSTGATQSYIPNDVLAFNGTPAV